MKRLALWAIMTVVSLAATANTYTDSNGIVWTYSVENGNAWIGNDASPAIPKTTSGAITIPSKIPSTLGAYPVVGISAFAFSGCRGLTSITIPSGSIERIGDYAFSGCSGLAKVTMGSGVTSIGTYAFYGCSGLASVTIPTSVTWIGSSAFKGCSGIKSVTIPNNVTSIGSGSFSGCSGLTSVTICNGVTTIASSMFEDCSGLTRVTIPNSVTSIGSSAFKGCSGLVSMTIPNSVTSIGSSVFKDCNGLTSITIPNSVTSIGNEAFYGCDGLKIVTIGNGVTSIGSFAFYNCSGLTSLMIPDSVKSIGDRAFSGCSGLSENGFFISKGVLYQYIGNGGSVVVPDNVVSIWSYAFSGCVGLTSVTMPNSVTSIGSYAFKGCSGIKSITIPNRVSSIGKGMFEGCSALTRITIPNSVTSIGSEAFYGCSSLTSITIPNSITSIGTSAFYGCNSLGSITIPDSVTSIGSEAFSGCRSLTRMTIPNSVTSIGSYMFYCCTGLTSVTIGSGVTSIGFYAFYNCSNLTSVTIPNSVTSIDSYAFFGCSGLFSISVGNGNKNFSSVNGLLLSKDGKQLIKGVNGDVVIPNGVTKISNRAFAHCVGLRSVIIPDSVTSIGDSAFEYCSGLTNIEIGSGMLSIGVSAFGVCTSLTNIVFFGNAPAVNDSSFYLVSSECKVLVQSDTTGWGGDIPGVWKGLRIEYHGDHECNHTEGTSIMNAIGPSCEESGYSGDTVCANCGVVLETGAPIPALGHVEGEGVVTQAPTETEEGIMTYCCIRCDKVLRTEPIARLLPSPDWTINANGVLVGVDCKGLTDVVIPNNVRSIGYRAFYGCSGLTSVTIPDSVTSIGSYAFSTCTNLTSVTIPQYVCSGRLSKIFPLSYQSITNVVISDAVTNIGPYAFDNCSSLVDVTIGNGVTNIGEHAFSCCSALTSVTIPSSVTSIGEWVFLGCDGLTSVHITDLAKWCGISFGNYYANPLLYAHNLYVNDLIVTDLVIPDGVTSIGDEVFYSCTNLTSVTIPNSVTSIGVAAFKGCSGLTSVTIGDSVASIGDEAFTGCSGLTGVYITDLAKWCGISFGDCYANPLCYAHNLYMNDSVATDLVIPDGVTRIGDEAFYCCTNLTSVTIPDSVTIIGGNAFSGCSGLKSVLIPDSITSIGSSAFSGCNGLASMTIPDSVTNIGSSAFCYCSSLTSVTIPDSVTSIGGSTFSGCSGLTSVTIGCGATSIGSSAFKGCSSLTSITIPDGVTSIGSEAFYGCSSLTSMIIPDSVTSIGYYAFSGCSGLTSVTIGNGVTSIGDLAFSGCSGLTSVTIPQYVCNIRPSSIFSSAYKTILNVVIQDGVTRIGDYAFSDFYGLTSVTIPSSVTSIGERAFDGCYRLTSVYITDIAKWCGISFDSYANPLFNAHNLYMNDSIVTDLVIPEGVTSIGDEVFECCTNLTSLTIPYSVTNIGSSAFWNCSGLTSVSMPDSVISIGGRAFARCSSLTSITIPNSVTSIGGSAFSGCSGLKSLTIPDGATITGQIQFEDCGGLTSIKISNGVTSIGNFAFKGCSGLKSVIIPDSVTSIGSYAFQDCRSLTSVTIPDGVTRIGSCAFRYCYGLTRVYITDLAKWCGISFDDYYANPLFYAHDLYVNDSAVIDLVIPDSVTSIGNHAFSGCSSLASVSIPASVMSIGHGSFRYCSKLTSVIIPKSVTSIGGDVFSGCGGLEELTLPFIGSQRGNTGSSDSMFCYIFGLQSYTGGLLCYSPGGSRYYIPSKLRKVVVTDETILGYGAFYGCSGLTSVTISGSVVSIGDSAFQNCKSLQHVSVPGWLRGRIDESNVFSNCPATLEIVYEETIGLYLDAPGLSFTDGDASDWCCDNVISHDGRGSVCLKGLGANSKSSIVLTLPSAGRLFFWWKASSESYGDDVFDYAYLSVDGVDKGTRTVDNEEYRLSGCAIGGSTDWKQIVVDIEGVGPHTVRWTYVKDEIDDGDVGEDCVWLDELAFVPLVSARFDIGGGMGAVPPMVKELRGAVIELPGQDGIEWEDHVFNGWSDGVTLYAPGAEYTVPSEDVTLTAQWTKKTFIVFDLGGGVGTVPPMVKELRGTIIELPGREGIECEDHVFDGWSDGVTLYAAGAEYMIPSEDVTLTAQWTKKTFLAFDLDGGVGMVPPMVKELRGTIIELPGQEGFEREDHVFNGWSDGANLYAAGAEYTMPDEDVTLTAQWTKKTFLAFDLGGGDGTVPQMVKELRGAVIELPGQDGIEWGDHVFNGWSDGVNTYVAGAEYTVPDEDVTLTAQWTKKTFLAFDIGGGMGAVPPMVKELRGSIIELPGQDGIEWEDHVFNGWSDGVTLYAPNAEYTVPSEDVTLTAQWTKKTFLAFDLGGGEGTVPSMVKELRGTVFELPGQEGFEWEDHVFDGWSDGVNTYVAGAEYTMPDEDITLTAQWIAKRIVTFVLDGGDGEVPATVKDIPDSVITLPSAEGFVKARHRFVGWSDGTKVYEAGAEYVVSDSNIEFSAVWEAKTLAAPAISSADVENGGTHEAAYALISMTAENGASIYYTVDGTEPTTNGILYVAPIMALGMTEIIRAIAVRDDYFDSAISEFAFSRKPYSAAECLNVEVLTVSTGEDDSAWSRVLGSAAHDGVAAMRSGAIGDGESSSIEMTVVGAGEIGFWWKSSSEISRNRKFDYVSFLIDGVEQSWMGGEMDWTNVVFAVTGSGVHTFKWVYQKNDNGLTKGEDCAWLDGVTWTPTDPIPAVATDAAPEAVTNAIESAGFADAEALKAAIAGIAAKYAAFKEWAGRVKGAGSAGASAAGEAAVVANTNAAAAYLLGAERLFENAPVVEIGEMEVRRQDAGSPSQGVTVSVVVKDGEEAVRCAAEKVKEMFEATRELGDWEGEARLTPTVDVLDGDGATMRFKVTPGDGKSSSAFLRIRK